ncbi:MAG: phytanoyl-CoA dioxygenase family protein [Candidatus Puniceispirillales bacterium]
MDISALVSDYHRDGYVSGVPILNGDEATYHRQALEDAEKQLNTSLHYQSKMHTIHTSPLALATRPEVLDLVEAMIGPDILLYNCTYIIKEPHSPSHVSWHQDLTYWGLSHDDQVSMWLALSIADEVSGCMRMIPGSHMQGRYDHEVSDDSTNVLLQSQTVHNVDENKAVLCPLKPGEASFHHGWTLHASMPNHSDDRRIGLNVQYLAAHVRQTKHDLDTAMLVRGKDNYHHFETDIPAHENLAPDALKRQKYLDERYKMIAGNS